MNGFRVPFTPFSYFISVPTVTNSAAILVCRRVTGSAPYRDLRSNVTTFYLSEIPFFPHRNLIFRIFYLNGKRPKFYELITAQSRSTSHEKVKCNSSTKQEKSILRENLSTAVNVFQVFTFNKFKSTLKHLQVFFKSVFKNPIFKKSGEPFL